MVANDRSGNYMAYSITTANKDNGVVRVTNRKTSDRCDCDSTRSECFNVFLFL